MYWIEGLKSKNHEKEKNERVQRVCELTKRLGAKLESMGIKRKSVLMAAADLGDIYQYAGDVRKLIELLLETPAKDWDRLGDIFAPLKVLVGQVKDHAVHSHKPLDYLIDYCDDKLSEESEQETSQQL